MLWNRSLYGNYRQITFAECWSNANAFLEEYQDNGLEPVLTEQSARTLYYLLYGKYANSVIAASDINRFKYRVWGLIYDYGPSWQKELQIQKELRDLTNEEMQEGTTQINNHAFNPSTEPATNVFDPIPTINDQTQLHYKSGKLQGYNNILMALKKDVTESFLSKFEKLFLQIVQPERPLWYVSDPEEYDINE